LAYDSAFGTARYLSAPMRLWHGLRRQSKFQSRRTLKPTRMDTDGDQIVFAFEDQMGEPCEARIGTLEAATMLSVLPRMIEEIVGKPTDRNPMMLGMTFVQLLETKEEVWLGISIGDHGVFHDYPVPKGTTLAEDLRFLSDRVAARQEAKVTHPQSGNSERKH
jgi:hypothetical protein